MLYSDGWNQDCHWQLRRLPLLVFWIIVPCGSIGRSYKVTCHYNPEYWSGSSLLVWSTWANVNGLDPLWLPCFLLYVLSFLWSFVFNSLVLVNFYQTTRCLNPEESYLHPNNIWLKIYIIELLVWYSLATLHFISLWSKYSPVYPVLRHPQSVFFPEWERPGFTPI